MGVLEPITTTLLSRIPPPFPSAARQVLRVSTEFDRVYHCCTLFEPTPTISGLERLLGSSIGDDRQPQTDWYPEVCSPGVYGAPTGHWAGPHPLAPCLQDDVLLLQCAMGVSTVTTQPPGAPSHGLNGAPASLNSDAAGHAAAPSPTDCTVVPAGKLAAEEQRLQVCCASLQGVQEKLASTKSEAAILTVRISRRGELLLSTCQTWIEQTSKPQGQIFMGACSKRMPGPHPYFFHNTGDVSTLGWVSRRLDMPRWQVCAFQALVCDSSRKQNPCKRGISGGNARNVQQCSLEIE
jgi:hypothetical protein